MVTSSAAKEKDQPAAKPIGKPIVYQGRGGAAAAVSPGGELVLTVGGEDFSTSELRLWHAGTGKPSGKPIRIGLPSAAVAFSPDGKKMAAASGDSFAKKGEARVWDVGTGKAVTPSLKHNDAVNAVAFSPDGNLLATGSQDGTPLGGERTGQALHLAPQTLGRRLGCPVQRRRQNTPDGGPASGPPVGGRHGQTDRLGHRAPRTRSHLCRRDQPGREEDPHGQY